MTTQARRPGETARPSAARPTGHGTRIAGLDGLRAIAIIAVLAFHLDPTWLPGGFIGVDVFFVVSGLLITTLLQRELARSGRIDLRAFWVRRARRLLPALVACVVGASIVARLVNPDLIVHLGRQVLGALTFSTNWLEIAAGSNYFDASTPTLFMNFWSLAVEEQFYLLWPGVVLLMFAMRLTLRRRAQIALAVGGISAILMAVLAGMAPSTTRAYYGTDSHLSGLMLGAGLALVTATGTASNPLHTRWWARWRRLAIVVAAVVLGGLLVGLDESRMVTFRGGIVLAALATTVLVAGLLPSRGQPGADAAESRWARVMSAPALRWIGVRSYGIYLWHWPVILIIGTDLPTAAGTLGHTLNRLWCVVVILALADLSYRFVEAPILAFGFRRTAVDVLDALLSPVRRAPRLAAGGVVLLLLTAGALTATAPTSTSTERLLEANAAAADPATAALASAGAAVAGSSTAAPSARPTGAPTSGATGTTGTAGPASPTGPTGTATASTTAAPGAPTAPGNATFTMPQGSEIDIFGDSIVVGSLHALNAYLPGIYIDGKSNRWWKDGLAQVQARGPALRRAVVLDFGTNAGIDEAVVRQTLDTIGPDRMVVLVNLYGRASWIDEANAALATAAQGRPNVIVANWHDAIAARPNLLQSDGIHPGIIGAHLYVQVVRDALAALSQRHTGVAVSLPPIPDL